jgi:hypothetical protein
MYVIVWQRQVEPMWLDEVRAFACHTTPLNASGATGKLNGIDPQAW